MKDACQRSSAIAIKHIRKLTYGAGREVRDRHYVFERQAAVVRLGRPAAQVPHHRATLVAVGPPNNSVSLVSCGTLAATSSSSMMNMTSCPGAEKPLTRKTLR